MAKKHGIDDDDDWDALAQAREGVRSLPGREDYVKPARKSARSKKPESKRNDKDDPGSGSRGPSSSMSTIGKILCFQGRGVENKEMQRLEAGKIRIEDRICLRERSYEDAKQSLERFIQNSSAQGKRCVLVIHGKGHSSPDGRSVIKEDIGVWLKGSRKVIAYCSALRDHGGTGALYVLLGKSGTVR